MSTKRGRSGNYFVYPGELDALLFSSGTSTERAAKMLGRTTRTIRDWRTGKRPVPRWAFRLVQLMLLEAYDQWRVLPRIWVYPGDLDLRRQLVGYASNEPDVTGYPQGESELAQDISPSVESTSRSNAFDLFLNGQALAGRPVPALRAVPCPPRPHFDRGATRQHADAATRPAFTFGERPLAPCCGAGGADMPAEGASSPCRGLNCACRRVIPNRTLMRRAA